MLPRSRTGPQIQRVFLSSWNQGSPATGVLSGYNEPLLHPRFFDFVEEAHDRDIGLVLVTNATLMTEAKPENKKGWPGKVDISHDPDWKDTLTSAIKFLTNGLDPIPDWRYKSMKYPRSALRAHDHQSIIDGLKDFFVIIDRNRIFHGRYLAIPPAL